MSNRTHAKPNRPCSTKCAILFALSGLSAVLSLCLLTNTAISPSLLYVVLSISVAFQTTAAITVEIVQLNR